MNHGNAIFMLPPGVQKSVIPKYQNMEDATSASLSFLPNEMRPHHNQRARYLLPCFSHFLSPSFYAILDPVIFLPIFFAEISLALWLTVKGVNQAKWLERESIKEY